MAPGHKKVPHPCGLGGQIVKARDPYKRGVRSGRYIGRVVDPECVLRRSPDVVARGREQHADVAGRPARHVVPDGTPNARLSLEALPLRRREYAASTTSNVLEKP